MGVMTLVLIALVSFAITFGGGYVIAEKLRKRRFR